MGVDRKIIYFAGCFANYYNPGIAASLAAVFERNGIEVIFPATRCCGMPQMANGNIKGAGKNFLLNVSRLAEAAASGYDILTTCPSCNMMLRTEGLPFFDSEEARFVSRRVYDACEYLLNLYRSGGFKGTFGSLPLRIYYHNPCHLKVQNIDAAVTLMQMVPRLQLAGVNTACCGMGGSYGMKSQNYRRSIGIAEKVWADVRQARPDIVVTDCGGCGLQINAGTGVQVMHPVIILNYAQTKQGGEAGKQNQRQRNKKDGRDFHQCVT